MLDELLATSGVVEHCALRSPAVGFLAIHGGLEAITFEIARAAAMRCGASLYAVVQPDDLQWHVPSHRYVVSQAPKLQAFCEHVDIAISLHGYGGVRGSDHRWTTALLGGARRDVASDLAAVLQEALGEHYHFVSELHSIPTAYRGVHPSNPVNCTRGGGVQIELPPRIRGSSPMWEGADRNEAGFVPHTEQLVAALAAFGCAAIAGAKCR